MTAKALISNAVRLRLILLIVLFLLIFLAGLCGFLGLQYLNKQALEVQQVVFEAANSDQKLQRIQELSRSLEKNVDAVDRAKQIVAESKSYQYQDVIIRDLQTMATQAGVTITNFDFGAASTDGSATSTPPAPVATPAPGGTTTPTASLRSTTVNITLDNPVDYKKLLTFIHYIEQNLTKMQISKIGLAGTESNDSPDAVTSEALTIEVYIR